MMKELYEYSCCAAATERILMFLMRFVNMPQGRTQPWIRRRTIDWADGHQRKASHHYPALPIHQVFR